MQASAFDKAIPVLRQLLADEPWLPQGVAMLAQAYTESGQTAERHRPAQGRGGDRSVVLRSLGEAYEKQERWSDAAAAYEQAAEQSPRDTALKTRWAFALLSMPDDAGAKRARDLLLDVTKANPTEGWPLYLLARAQRALGDLDASEAQRAAAAGHQPRQHVGGARAGAGARGAAPVAGAHRGARAGRRETLLHGAAKPTPRSSSRTSGSRTSKSAGPPMPWRPSSAPPTLDPSERRGTACTSAQALVAAKQYDGRWPLVREARGSAPRRCPARAPRGRRAARARPLRRRGGPAQGRRCRIARRRRAASRRSPNSSRPRSATRRPPRCSRTPSGASPDDPGVQFQYGAMLERQKQSMPRPRRCSARSSRRTPSTRRRSTTSAIRWSSAASAATRPWRSSSGPSRSIRTTAPTSTASGWAYFKLNQLDLAEPPSARRGGATAAGLRRPGSLGRPAREARPLRRGRRGLAPGACRRRRAD